MQILAMILNEKIALSLKKILSKEFNKNPVIKNFDKILSKQLEFKDEHFDKILPPYYLFCSTIHWTSFEVAIIIAEWLQNYEKRKFIDIGCGPGKLCLYLRIYTTLNIHGIEQRKNLVNIANEIINTNNVSNIKILHMNMLDLRWDEYDIFYLFNPFYEHSHKVEFYHIDNNIKHCKEKYDLYLSVVYENLERLQKGKIIITYHGFGKIPPLSWKLINRKYVRSGFLEMWEKQ